MKDILISKKRQKTELKIFTVCFMIAFILNIISIIIYNTRWNELLTHIGYVAAIAVFLYLITGIFRLLIALITNILKKLKN